MEAHGSVVVARSLVLSCGLALPLMLAGQAAAVISSGASGFNGVDLNTYLGANAYYALGLTGTRTRIGNLEAGHVWNGHNATIGSNISYFTPTGAAFAPTPTFPANTPNYDFHATMVGSIMVGSPGTDPVQRGIAYGSSLLSTNIAISFTGTGNFLGSFTTNTNTILLPALNRTWRTGAGIGGTVDVHNSSWGSAATANANGTLRVIAEDALIYDSRKVVVWSAGNSGPGAGTVGDPAIAKNNIAVGALTGQSDAIPYNTIASFSSRGPENFFLANAPQAGVVIAGVRAPVDISAPGDTMTMAAYLGRSGGNLNNPVNSLVTNNYFINNAGTSFAAPIVTGAAALVVDAARAYGYAQGTDGRVVKAILMNAADKTGGWTNNATNIAGVNTTTQGIDWAYGAGRVNMTTGLRQQTAGTTDVPGMGGGNVFQTGWDFGTATQGAPNRYQIDSDVLFGHTFTATLSWWAREVLDFNLLTTASAQFGAQDRLTLQLFRGETTNLGAAVLVAESISTYNLNQHINFTIPQTGKYFVQVNWSQNLYNLIAKGSNEDFGLAWRTTVPTPGAATLAAFAGLFAARRRRR